MIKVIGLKYGRLANEPDAEEEVIKSSKPKPDKEK